MSQLDFRITGVDRSDLEAILAETGFPNDAHTIDEPEFASGIELLELLIELSKVDVSLLDLFLGYCLGKGISLSQIKMGLEKPIENLKEAKKLSDEFKQDQDQNSE